jgi:diacylglycerol kinase (ATP)
VADTLAIVNPESNRGRTSDRWARVEAQARQLFGELDVSYTQRPGDAERIAREAVQAGARRLVVAGGDGTASEVAAGLLGAGLAERASLALLPLGTASDFARALGLPRDPARALARIAHGGARKIDAGRLRCMGGDGRESVRHFVNVVSAGFGGRVDRRVHERPTRLGVGGAAFLLATLRALVDWRDIECRVELDGALLHDGPLVLVAAANGGVFGGGMRIAPHARIDDGRLDVVLIRSMWKPRLLASLPLVYFGAHLGHPAVLYRQGSLLRIEVGTGEIELDIDGEAFAARRLEIEILPGAIHVLGANLPLQL